MKPRRRPLHPLRKGHAPRPSRPRTGPVRDQREPSLAALVAGAELDLPETVVDALDAFLVRMLKENEKLNLTGIRDLGRARILHALDSLQVWSVVARAPRLIVDLGSGNGFPGVAAACLWPDARTILVERTHKKAAAIARCLADVGLDRVEIRDVDASQIHVRSSELLGACDLVVTRAMCDLDRATQLAAPLLLPTGCTVVHWKAAELQPEERSAGVQAAKHFRLLPREDHIYVLPGEGRDPTPRPRRLVSFVRG